jgi:hypothetical protein
MFQKKRGGEKMDTIRYLMLYYRQLRKFEFSRRLAFVSTLRLAFSKMARWWMTEEPQKQYWIDLVGYMTRGGMAVAPLETVRSEGTGIDNNTLRMMAELLIPYHAPDGKKYGFTVYILNKPNYVPAFEEMRALLAMAPEMVERFGAQCREVLV